MSEYNNDFLLLITGSPDNDAAAERAAGSGPIIHHKLSYVPVYGEFDQLKKFQVKLRNSPAFIGKRVFAAIDVSEWIGHEDEEYFTIALKFFHDKRSRIKYIFTVGSNEESKTTKLFFKLRLFLGGKTVTDDTFMNKESLAKYISCQCVENKTAELIADMVMSKGAEMLRTYPAVNSMCREMRLSAGGNSVTSSDAAKYLSDKNSLPAIISVTMSEEYARRAYELTARTTKKSA